MLEFISDNWVVLVVPLVGLALAAFRALAKRSANKWDDKIVAAADAYRDEALNLAKDYVEKRLAVERERAAEKAADESPSEAP